MVLYAISRPFGPRRGRSVAVEPKHPLDGVPFPSTPSTRLPETTRTRIDGVRPPRHRNPTAGVQQQKTIKQTNEAVIRLDLEKKQAVRKADREHRTMLQYKTLLAESKTPLLLAQKEIASLQKELDSFRKAVDAKAKEKDAMERAAKFAKAETEKVCERRPCAIFMKTCHRGSSGTAERPEPAQNRKPNDPRPPVPEPTAFTIEGRKTNYSNTNPC